MKKLILSELPNIAILAKIAIKARYTSLVKEVNVMNVTATELKNRLGQYLDAAQIEPVIIEKSGRESSVVLSKRRYDELVDLEDKLWDMKAQQAEKEGFLSDDETRQLLDQ